MIESFADKIVDPVGAGDALLAYSTLTLLSTKNEVIASIIGSFAAGIECELNGNHPVKVDQILEKINFIEKKASYS